MVTWNVRDRILPCLRALSEASEGLDVETIVPIHGLPVAWSDFVEQLDSGR